MLISIYWQVLAKGDSNASGSVAPCDVRAFLRQILIVVVITLP